MIVRLKKDSEMNICKFADELSSAGIAFENLQLIDDIWQLECSGESEPRVLAVLDTHDPTPDETDHTIEIKKSEWDALQERIQVQDGTLNDLLFTVLPEVES